MPRLPCRKPRHLEPFQLLTGLCGAEIPCKPGAGLGKDRLKPAGTIRSQALLTQLHSAGICE
jgi:hypothetical protein